MTTRRQIIQAGAAIGAAAAPATAALAAPRGPAALGYRKVAFDSRLEPSVIFAAEARRLGADIHDINGDITSLYVDHLLGPWRSSPDPVAGMTAYSSMFVLKMMAESAGLRLIYRAHHEGAPEAAAAHAQFGPTAVLEQAGDLSGRSLEWTRKAARIVMTWPKAQTSRATALSTIAQSDDAAIRNDTLVSWILAPAIRA